MSHDGNPGSKIYSSSRGLILNNDAGVWNMIPAINNAGEVVVYTQGAGDNEVVSNVRGALTSNNLNDYSPSINNNGEVVWHGWDGDNFEVFSNVRGQLTNTGRDNYVWYGPSINDNGEIVWYGSDGHDNEIYSSVRGQLTNNDFDDQAPTINSLGEIVWMSHNPALNGYQLYSSKAGLIDTGLDARYPVVNDFGLIAFQSGQNVFLAKPNVVPEPASMLLFGIGGLAMAVLKRKKKHV